MFEAWRRSNSPTHVSAEFGENFRVATFEAASHRDVLAASPLVRFALPVMLQLKRRLFLADEQAATAQLLELGDRCEAQSLTAFPIRRSGESVAQRLNGRGVGRQAISGSAVLCAAVSDEWIFAGVASSIQTGSPYPGGMFRQDAHLSLSRARWKLVEALDRLTWLGFGAHVEAARNWLELGAHPGGMTSELARRGRQVTAVDRVPVDERSQTFPGVTRLQADAYSYEPINAVDAILCDLNCSPALAAAAVARLAATKLNPHGLVIHTIKLPEWNQGSAIVDRTVSAFRGVGLRTVGIYHGFANRRELTYLGFQCQHDCASGIETLRNSPMICGCRPTDSRQVEAN